VVALDSDIGGVAMDECDEVLTFKTMVTTYFNAIFIGAVGRIVEHSALGSLYVILN
jgi:hypothetical protein